ncbi:MAG: SDR family NAD(P)-dependent oxidoreductase [Pseudobdellovibrionaceae bacterium]
MANWVLITGASAGIGEATAWKLAEAGHSLFLLARRSDRLQKLKQAIEKKHSVAVRISTLDVRDEMQIQTFVKENECELKNLETLINNAGLARGSDPFQTSKLDDWDQMIDTNIKGLLYLTRALLPFLLANQKGHIVNLGSVAGRWVYPGGAVYCATKHAVRAISEALRLDLLGKNIRVSNIEPGMVQTEFSLVRFESQDKADQVYAGMKPLTADDIAETIAWVLNRPKHVNIQELVIYPTDQASVRDVWRK